MKLNAGAVSIVLMTASLPALAQTPAPQTSAPGVPTETPAPTAPAPSSTLCYEVVSAAINVVPYAPILIDRCSGRTWILAADRGVDAQGKPTGAFAFRWHPLGNTADEAVLAIPEPPRLSTAPTPNANAGNLPKPPPAPNANAGNIKKPAVR